MQLSGQHPAKHWTWGGDQLKTNQTRNWSVRFPGRLGSDEINFFSIEKDLGQNLAGERNRCMILAEGAASGRPPTKLLKGYKSDGWALRGHLPDGTNSMVKLHLDPFQMNFDGPMPNNEEIASDLLARPQPMFYHHSQTLGTKFRMQGGKSTSRCVNQLWIRQSPTNFSALHLPGGQQSSSQLAYSPQKSVGHHCCMPHTLLHQATWLATTQGAVPRPFKTMAVGLTSEPSKFSSTSPLGRAKPLCKQPVGPGGGHTQMWLQRWVG